MPPTRKTIDKGKRRADPLFATNFDHNVERYPFFCDVEGCSKGFKSLSSLQRHQPSHNGPENRLYRCSVEGCEFTANFEQGLKTHYNSRHLKVRSYCDECSKSYADPSGLSHHRKRKHPKPNLAPEKQIKKPKVRKIKSARSSREVASIERASPLYEEPASISSSPSFQKSEGLPPPHGYEALVPCGPGSAYHIWQPQPVPFHRYPTPFMRGSSSRTRRSLNTTPGPSYNDVHSSGYDATHLNNVPFTGEATFGPQPGLYTMNCNDTQQDIYTVASTSSLDNGHFPEVAGPSRSADSTYGYAQLLNPDQTGLPSTSSFAEEHGATIYPQYNPTPSDMLDSNLSATVDFSSSSNDHQPRSLEDLTLMDPWRFFEYLAQQDPAFLDVADTNYNANTVLSSAGSASRPLQPAASSSTQSPSSLAWTSFSPSSGPHNH
ncbi:hypothetical protein CPB83DRAFT_911613 [Crepidotus variabilis]|uniref:C2H2-type domain-containing protein n=1 Tax=Crepidotus variabilis TaxID=179855 RepID=A0A9P6JIB8_9AGAR|nr:hypothetical protein CPB83DRAFT_911613 [Crepidotus variabilis]